MKKLLSVLALVLFASAAVFADEETKDIPISDLKKAIKKGKVVVLDTNGSKSFSKGHIPGAIDFKANKDKLASLLPKDKKMLIVAYCGGPSCEAYLAGIEAVKELGYTNVAHFSGGISGWIQAGETTEQDS